ncbi:MAG: tRNA(Met) cytidine acetyltransferase TmcA domain-containing protein, partial [Candidatus Bathyarchaeia archaeon]
MSADRIRVEQMLRYMMEEASRALHRRLLVVSGDSSEEMLAYIIWRHHTLSGGHNRVLYVGYEDSQDAYKCLLDRLKEVYPVDSIKWYSYEDTHKIMGTTNDFLILDMRSGARPNDIGRLVETVRGGGLIVLYNLSIEVDKPWSTSLHRKLVVPPYSEKDLKARFEKRFIRKLLDDPAVWVIKDWNIMKGELLNPPETIREKPIPPKGGKIPAKILSLAITSEQMDRLRRMDVLVDKGKSIVVITSNRGRGKSALLGLTAASLIFLGAERIIVTAPACEEVQTLM